MDAIFTFHSIDSTASVLSYSKAELTLFVEGLAEDGVRFVSLAQLLAEPASTAPRAALTFDDGLRSAYDEALPVLEEAGAPATFFVVSDFVGKTNDWPDQPAHVPRSSLMDWSMLADLAARGFDIGSHGASHCELRRIDARRYRREIVDSQSRLADRLGRAVRHFAYPYGIRSPSAVETVKGVYDGAVTTRLRYMSPSCDAHQLPRIDAYYLRKPERWRPIFGRRTERYLRARSAMRAVRGLFPKP